MLARSLFSIVCVCVSSFSLAEVVAKEYPVKDFSEFVASGESKIEISQTGKEYLRIEAEADVMKYVKVDQTGGRVSVWARKNGNFWSWFNQSGEQIKVTLHVNKLDYLELSGAAEAKVGDLTAGHFSLESSGAANVKFANLKAEQVKVGLSGAANFWAESLASSGAAFDLSGASNLEIKSASTTDKLSAGVSGASNIRAKNLTAKVAKLDASGASHIEISVTDELDAEASGASSINYKGAPKARTRATGASSVNAHD